MMTNRKKEIAKFMCGVEAFHALAHTVFGLNRTTFKVLGMHELKEERGGEKTQ
jgi:hypothetical protein